MPNAFKLSELETDLLGELFNIGVGRAAGSLSKMLDQTVALSVPSVEFVTVTEMSTALDSTTSVCSIAQNMKGAFDARSLLMFPEESGMEVVRQMMGRNLSDELIAELREEALSEIGNIVLNAFIGTIGTTLKEKIDVGLPEFKVGHLEELLSPSVSSDTDSILLVYITMELRESKIKSYLVFLLGPSSQEDLQKHLKVMLEKIIG